MNFRYPRYFVSIDEYRFIYRFKYKGDDRPDLGCLNIGCLNYHFDCHIESNLFFTTAYFDEEDSDYCVLYKLWREVPHEEIALMI